MSGKIIPRDKLHLRDLVHERIKLLGPKCSLNHIDVSNIKDLSFLFQNTWFNGDISEWDVSNVIDMQNMFCLSGFNGDISNWKTSSLKISVGMFSKSSFNRDISKWNMSKATNIRAMFTGSKFNQDISDWDISKVENIDFLFQDSDFSHDVSKWKPISLRGAKDAFKNCPAQVPYWLNFNTSEYSDYSKAIQAAILDHELNSVSGINKKVMKV